MNIENTILILEKMLREAELNSRTKLAEYEYLALTLGDYKSSADCGFSESIERVNALKEAIQACQLVNDELS